MKNCIESGALIVIVKTFKVRKKGLVICGGILIALLVILIVCGIVHKATAKTYPMKTESERQAFMSEMGWEVSEEYTSCKVVSIPEEFNETYESYNELQKEQGFNLKKYKGEMVEIYTYAVYNYPGNPENVVINLMVFDGNLIGGDVSCNELDGFMQGLKNPDPDDKASLDEKESEEEEIVEDESKNSESSSAKSKKDKENASSSSSDVNSKSDKKQAKNAFDSSADSAESDLDGEAEVETETANVTDNGDMEESSTEQSSQNTSAESSSQQW